MIAMTGDRRELIENLMRRFLRSRIIQKVVREAIIHIPGTYSPYLPQTLSYALMKQAPSFLKRCSQNLPIPPNSLRHTYGKNYLDSGKRDTSKMRFALESAGHPLVEGQRILELGCAAGRMLRWLYDVSDRCEIWGADIMADNIIWCSQNLSPPFHFVTTSTYPHLPFEDRYFDLVFGGSVFTHIDDMAKTWFLELRRVLKPGAVLYITIHDRHTISQLQDMRGNYHGQSRLAKLMVNDKKILEWVHSDFGKFTIGRFTDSQVFYDLQYLMESLTPFFKCLSVKEQAYGFQTGIVLERQ
jgi:ubiquinone/menaquinone biosynthesis C-methylase UbiE